MAHDRSDDEADPVLREILAALAMPRSGLRAWLGQLQEFCDKHGGARHYADLLELIEQCRTELGRTEPGRAVVADPIDRGDQRAHRRPDPAGR